VKEVLNASRLLLKNTNIHHRLIIQSKGILKPKGKHINKSKLNNQTIFLALLLLLLLLLLTMIIL